MRRMAIVLTTALLVLTLTAPVATASHGPPHGFVRDRLSYGFFYGDFEQALLFVGGPVHEFCSGEPGEAPMRLFFPSPDQVEFRVDEPDQPAYLYLHPGDAIEFLMQVCAGEGDPPAPDGVGTVRLKVRDTLTFDGPPSPEVMPIHIDVRNSVVGSVRTTDGTWWRVRAWADLELEQLMTPEGPILVPTLGSGSPQDFQDLSLHRTAR